jgi:hypothetical protein
VLKQVTGDTHANVQVKVKQTRMAHKRTINAQENRKVDLGKLVYEEN